MSLRSFVLAILVLPIALGTLLAKSRNAVFEQINSIVTALSEISGLPELHPVPYGRMDKAQLRKFLNKRIQKTVKPEEIRANEIALKMFGLVPQDFDLKGSTVDLLTEQAAAFYDYDKKKLFLLESRPGPEETTTLAHELSHALADQHFDLQKFMDDPSGNDDADLARTAVVEGQASWLMIAYALKQNGQDPAPTDKTLKEAFGEDASTISDYPVLKASPLYIQESLLFPYSEGALFFDAVYRRDGKAAFSEVFTDPPVDSAQILHPARYFGHVHETRPALPSVPNRADFEEISAGDVGEFDHSILLRQYGKEQPARDLAPHLRGGQYRILSGKDGHSVLIYSSEWDTPENAARFFQAYQHVLQSKWKKCAPEIATAAEYAGSGDNGYFVSRLSDATFTSIEGIADRKDWDFLSARESSPLPRTAILRRAFPARASFPAS